MRENFGEMESGTAIEVVVSVFCVVMARPALKHSKDGAKRNAKYRAELNTQKIKLPDF